MGHQKKTLATDDEQDIVLERCDCSQYSLSIGPVTVQMEEDAVIALTRLLVGAVGVPQDEVRVNTPLPNDVQ